jgi:hypothetical protein
MSAWFVNWVVMSDATAEIAGPALTFYLRLPDFGKEKHQGIDT